MSDSIDLLAITCKVLYNERIVQQRNEIERLKQEIEKLKRDEILRLKPVWCCSTQQEAKDKAFKLSRDFPQHDCYVFETNGIYSLSMVKDSKRLDNKNLL